MGDNMHIERLKKQEIPQLLALYKELADYENSVEICEQIFYKIDSDENYYLLVAKENNKIIGTALGIVCYSIPVSAMPFMIIEDVVVKKEYRKKGVGKKLFEKLDKIANENNCAYSFLVSGEKRKGAHKFYLKQGYNEPVKGFRKKYI